MMRSPLPVRAAIVGSVSIPGADVPQRSGFDAPAFEPRPFPGIANPRLEGAAAGSAHPFFQKFDSIIPRQPPGRNVIGRRQSPDTRIRAYRTGTEGGHHVEFPPVSRQGHRHHVIINNIAHEFWPLMFRTSGNFGNCGNHAFIFKNLRVTTFAGTSLKVVTDWPKSGNRHSGGRLGWLPLFRKRLPLFQKVVTPNLLILKARLPQLPKLPLVLYIRLLTFEGTCVEH